MTELYQQLEDRERNRQRNLSNKATNTGAFAKFQTVGQGPFEFDEFVDFAVGYVEEPFMAYGAAIDASDLRDLLLIEDEEVVPPFPLTTGFVTEWQRDANGLYRGAWVGVRVHFPIDVPVASNVDVVVVHYYRFEGIALKAP